MNTTGQLDGVKNNPSKKYFHYISPEKVETLSMIAPRESFGLTSLGSFDHVGPLHGLDSEQESHSDELVAQTIEMIAALNSGRRQAASGREAHLQVSQFYHDCSVWRSGVFSFDSSCEEPTLVYVAWREVGNTLVLMCGSPNNIEGRKTVEGDCFVPGTQGAHLRILDFVDQTLGTDEGVMVAPNEPQTFGDACVVAPKLSNGNVIPRLHPRAMAARWHDITKGHLAMPPTTDEKGLRLGFLCLKNFLRLPQDKVEVVFRVFGEYSIPSAVEIERFGEWKPAEK